MKEGGPREGRGQQRRPSPQSARRVPRCDFFDQMSSRSSDGSELSPLILSKAVCLTRWALDLLKAVTRILLFSLRQSTASKAVTGLQGPREGRGQQRRPSPQSARRVPAARPPRRRAPRPPAKATPSILLPEKRLKPRPYGFQSRHLLRAAAERIWHA